MHIITKFCSFHIKIFNFNRRKSSEKPNLQASFNIKSKVDAYTNFFVVSCNKMYEFKWRILDNSIFKIPSSIARCTVAIATNTTVLWNGVLILNKKYLYILSTRSSAHSIKWTNTVNLCQMYNTTSLKSSLCQTDILRVIFLNVIQILHLTNVPWNDSVFCSRQ